MGTERRRVAMASSHTLDFTKGSVTKQLITFVIPIMLSALLQNLYTIADRIVVGRFVGDAALAAVGSTGSAISLILNLINGVAIGVNVVCANLKGAQKFKTLDKCMHTVMVLALIFGFGIGIFGFAMSKPILLMIGTPEAVLADATLYMQLYFAGVPVLALYNFGAGILRAHGDTKRPMYILMVTGLVNVGLNLLFVIVFHWGVAGVAIATMVAQMISAVVVAGILFSKKDAYKLELRKLRVHKDQAVKIIRVGVPCGLNGAVFSFANVILQSSVNSFNSVAIMAGYTAANDVSNFNYLVINSFNAGMVSFAGQCYGAREYKRIDKFLAAAHWLCCSILLVMAVAMTIWVRPILGLFNSEPSVIDAGLFRLLLCAWTYIFYAPSEIYTGCTRGMGRTTMPMILNLVGVCVPRIVWALVIFPLYRTPEFLYLCMPISWVISSVLQIVYYYKERKKLI